MALSMPSLLPWMMTTSLLSPGLGIVLLVAVILLGDGDSDAPLLLEPGEHLPLGPHHLVLLASDQEGQAPVLAGAHLNLGASRALNTGQFLVGIAAESFLAPPFLRRNME